MNARHEEARYLAQPVTPKSERRRNSWGSLLFSVAALPDRCQEDRKCFRRKDHDDDHYPKEDR